MLLIIPTLLFAADSPDGFQGMKWGDTPTLSEMTLLETRGCFSFYRRIEFQPLSYVESYNATYGFCKNQLCEVFGCVKGYDDFLLMQRILLKEYGKPNFYNPNNYFWLNETDIMITYDEKTETGFFLYHYNPLFLEIDKEREERIKILKAAKKKQKGR